MLFCCTPNCWSSSAEPPTSSCCSGKSLSPWWAPSCACAGGGGTGCCGRCSGRSTAHTCRASPQCGISCEPPGDAHRPRQRDTGGTCVASPLENQNRLAPSTSERMEKALRGAQRGSRWAARQTSVTASLELCWVSWQSGEHWDSSASP